MIDLEKDVHVTPQDLREQKRVRRRRQEGRLSLDDYMDFLASLEGLFPRLDQLRSREPDRAHPEKPFEL